VKLTASAETEKHNRICWQRSCLLSTLSLLIQNGQALNVTSADDGGRMAEHSSVPPFLPPEFDRVRRAEQLDRLAQPPLGLLGV